MREEEEEEGEKEVEVEEEESTNDCVSISTQSCTPYCSFNLTACSLDSIDTLLHSHYSLIASAWLYIYIYGRCTHNYYWDKFIMFCIIIVVFPHSMGFVIELDTLYTVINVSYRSQHEIMLVIVYNQAIKFNKSCMNYLSQNINADVLVYNVHKS